MRLLGSQSADAEDAVSITLVRALQQLSRDAPPVVNERAWLSRILYNVCMDMHRYHKHFVDPVTGDGQGVLEEGAAEAFQDVEQSAEEVLLARERSRELYQHIQALPPRLRIPFVMRFQHGMSYPEIATELKLTNCNVRKRIQLAYSQLRSASSGMARN
jgi:RNA polymerase sigma-70 factor (ECF subfamily)